MSQPDVTVQDQGRDGLGRPLFRYSIRAYLSNPVSALIIGTSMDGGRIAMFDDFVPEGEKLTPIFDYEGDDALSFLTGAIDRRMRDAGITNYRTDVCRTDLA